MRGMRLFWDVATLLVLCVLMKKSEPLFTKGRRRAPSRAAFYPLGLRPRSFVFFAKTFAKGRLMFRAIFKEERN